MCLTQVMKAVFDCNKHTTQNTHTGTEVDNAVWVRQWYEWMSIWEIHKNNAVALMSDMPSRQSVGLETASLSLSNNYLSRPVAALTHVERQGESGGIKEKQRGSRAGPAADQLKVKLKRNGGRRREGVWRPILQWKLHGACHGASVLSINPSTHTSPTPLPLPCKTSVPF